MSNELLTQVFAASQQWKGHNHCKITITVRSPSWNPWEKGWALFSMVTAELLCYRQHHGPKDSFQWVTLSLWVNKTCKNKHKMAQWQNRENDQRTNTDSLSHMHLHWWASFAFLLLKGSVNSLTLYIYLFRIKKKKKEGNSRANKPCTLHMFTSHTAFLHFCFPSLYSQVPVVQGIFPFWGKTRSEMQNLPWKGFLGKLLMQLPVRAQILHHPWENNLFFPCSYKAIRSCRTCDSLDC